MNVVQKYNGRCIDTVDKVKSIAAHIAANRNEGDGLVIVASAMGRTTQRLVSMAKEAGENIPKRELDTLLATGEQQAVALLAIALNNLGIPAVSVTGFQSGFIAGEESSGHIKEISTDKVEEIVAQGKVAVVAGFQGISENGDINALGRGGSDVTAVAIAAQLQWPCEIYSVADCLYTVDPELYPEAKKVNAITYEEMMELANLGSDTIETKAVELARKYDVELFFGKALENDKTKGTYIVADSSEYNDVMPITGLSMQDDVEIFTLRNICNDGRTVAKCFRLLGDMGINVDMISQQSTGADTCTVTFSASKCMSRKIRECIKQDDELSGIDVECEQELAMISLVGVGMAANSGVASKVFSALAQEEIRYYHITTSEISISVTVDMERKYKAATVLSRAFGL